MTDRDHRTNLQRSLDMEADRKAKLIADADAGLFDAVEELFKEWDIDAHDVHPESFLNPLWQAYLACIAAIDGEEN